MSDSLTTPRSPSSCRASSARWALTLTAAVEETPEGTRINLEGEDGGVLIRAAAKGLQALQHLVATAFRKQLGDDNRIVDRLQRLPPRQGRRAAADGEVHGGEGATTGAPQEMGPLNPYERRIVHMAIAEDPTVTPRASATRS